jgi:hypothetical protein
MERGTSSRRWRDTAGACALAALTIAPLTQSLEDKQSQPGANAIENSQIRPTDGSIVRPVKNQLAILDRAFSDPAFGHVFVDLSWDETAKYIVASPDTIAATADLINRHPDRFLFGTDEVAPTDQEGYLKVYRRYQPLFARLTPAASEKVRKGNYLRLFDEARRRVRAWENANVQ